MDLMMTAITVCPLTVFGTFPCEVMSWASSFVLGVFQLTPTHLFPTCHLYLPFFSTYAVATKAKAVAV